MKRSLIILSILTIPYMSVCQWNVTFDTVQDGFESDTLSNKWRDWRFLPGAIEFQSEIIHSGSKAIKITLKPGDQMEEEKNTILERAELTDKQISMEDSSYIYSFSLFLPQDFPVLSTRLVIAQWKQYCESGNCSIENPVLSLRYESGEFTIELKTEPKKVVLFSTNDDIRNQWLNFRFRIRFSRNPHGRIIVVLNDKEIINYTGITAYSQMYGYTVPGYFYFKMGLYRDHIDLPMSLYIDDYYKQSLISETYW